jgi:ubiquinone/menaquinone biosynthesis C-methylase UbiE
MLSVSFGQASKYDSLISDLSKMRSELIEENKTGFANLGRITKKWPKDVLESSDFKAMINQIIVSKQYFNNRDETLLSFIDKYWPHMNTKDLLDVSDLAIIEENSELIELILEGILKPNYPFALNRDLDVLSEFVFYDIASNNRVGEIGAGFGTFAFLISMIYKDVKLSINELNEDALDYVQTKFEKNGRFINLENVEFVKGDIDEVNFEDNNYDKIICRNTFHHFQKKKDMLKSIKKVLKKDGELLLLEQDNTLKQAPGVDRITFTPNQLLNTCNEAISLKKIIKLMKRNGFKLEEQEKNGERYYLLRFSLIK